MLSSINPDGVGKLVNGNNSLFVGILQSNVVLLPTPLFS
jgi:hypothetical protein